MDQGLLFISPHGIDHRLLARMLRPMGVSVHHASSLNEARQKLGDFRVILTESTLPDGDWTDVLNQAHEFARPPVVLVTDRLADNGLWAEVLNLGAYDLLAQPFDSSEVQRIVGNAFLRAIPRKAVPAPAVMTAGRQAASY